MSLVLVFSSRKWKQNQNFFYLKISWLFHITQGLTKLRPPSAVPTRTPSHVSSPACQCQRDPARSCPTGPRPTAKASALSGSGPQPGVHPGPLVISSLHLFDPKLRCHRGDLGNGCSWDLKYTFYRLIPSWRNHGTTRAETGVFGMYWHLNSHSRRKPGGGLL